MPEDTSEKMIITDDWTKNWKASIAVKITAVVMWVIIPFGFLIALLLVNSIKNDISSSVNDDAEILLNSARILLSENNSYNSQRTIKELDRKLKKSVYCKIDFSTANESPIVILGDGCHQKSNVVEKKYFFTTMTDGQSEELTLVLSHKPIPEIMIKYRSNTISLMIIIVIAIGLVLAWVIRLLVLKPLFTMVDTTHSISEGQHELRLKLDQDDEFGYLAKFLNKMLDQVFEQQKNLKHANLELMKEVAERNRITLELRSSRDQLEKIVDERTADLAVARDEALEANKAKNLFLANMSHEIRTPLNAILGYSQLLNRERGFTDKQLTLVKIIEGSGNQLLGLLNNILDISKIETGEIALNSINFNLNELINSLSDFFLDRCTEKGLHWHEQNELPAHALVNSDPQKLRQVLTNLLENAVRLTDEGDISLQVNETGNDRYLFEIFGSGSGFSLENINNISTDLPQEAENVADEDAGADTFFGLFIAKKYLELLGSELKLSPVVGKGNVFSFTIELKAAHIGFEIRQEGGMEMVRLAPSDTVKALVVDDIELSRNLLVDMLVEIDAVVISASNGQEAIQSLQNMALAELPNIIFMDIRMPVMDGVEAVKRIKNEYGDAIVCVAVTASTLDESDDKYFQAGFDDYISKPYRFEAVFDCMKKYLNVDFEYENINQAEDSEIVEIDFKRCHVEAPLCEKLLEASKTYALSNLKTLLAELSLCGVEEEKSAQQLTRLMEQYDIKKMVALIEKFDCTDEKK